MPESPIHIIGLGVAQKAELSGPAQAALERAEIVIGAERQLRTVASVLSVQDAPAKQLRLPKLAELRALVESHAGKNIAVLASGDPLYFGIGCWFCKNFKRERLLFYPAVSSIQAACHKVGLALQDVNVVSLHGRPLQKLRTHLKSNARLVILPDVHSCPRMLAEECVAAGFDQSTLTVFETLGYEQESIREYSVRELLARSELAFDPLHVTIIKVTGIGGILPEFPGIPDTSYITGAQPGEGMISKREVRLVILSLLQPASDDVIWDVGAGCGGVAVELALWNERVAVYAIEHHQERLGYLAANQLRFGVVANLHIVNGRAPGCLPALPEPNKVFIGGSDGELEVLLNEVWQKLPINGMLVASAVTESTALCLESFSRKLSEHQVASVELAVKRGVFEQGDMVYNARLPVQVFRFVKAEEL